MRKTTNYGLSLYDKTDKMIITAEENSLNANMEIIDKILKDNNVPSHVKAITQEDINKWNNNTSSGESGLTIGQINALNEMFKVCAYIKEDVSTEYGIFKTAFGIEEGTVPTKTLQSITATYTGGNVKVGTNVNSLTGITVKANYSDGTSTNVTGYTLSGTITEGNNTITVSYQGKTTTFTVIGVAESSGGSGETQTLDLDTAGYREDATDINGNTDSYSIRYTITNVKAGNSITTHAPDINTTTGLFVADGVDVTANTTYEAASELYNGTTTIYVYTFVAQQDYNEIKVAARTNYVNKGFRSTLTREV